MFHRRGKDPGQDDRRRLESGYTGVDGRAGNRHATASRATTM